MTLLPYAPLAGGFLSGKYQRGKPLPKNARLAYSSHHAVGRHQRAQLGHGREAARRSPRAPAVSMLDIAFGWLLAQARDGERDRRRDDARADRAERARRQRQALAPTTSPNSTAITRRHEHGKQRALIIGGSVGGLFAANLLRSIGWDADRVRAQPRGAGRPRRRHQHASAAARRHASGSASRSTIRWASAIDKVVFLDHDGQRLRRARRPCG